jgi:uncharacterized protein (DUF2236 family)
MMDDFRPVLRADDRVREALTFLTKPPLPRLARLPYSLLIGGAIVTIDPEYREMLGLKKPWWPASFLTRVMLSNHQPHTGNRVHQPQARPGAHRATGRIRLLLNAENVHDKHNGVGRPNGPSGVPPEGP